ncbi:MAG: CoA transferase, partial [Gammaproteobacteria bacterium]|nr:CoA transferase [Gammaproteobacteria bacterium]
MGPLKGFRILEIAGIGPSQFCGMLLADMGASIIRIDRPAGANPGTGI